MSNKTLAERCTVNTNIDTDTFVGIKAVNGNINIHFPLGFEYSTTESELRKEILLLLNVLAKNTNKKESEVNTDMSFNYVNLPIQAYLYIIADYYARGIYKETETVYTVSKRGKINWRRTVKTQKAFIQDEEIFFLDYVTKKNTINENELITLIHEACVYESFMKIGWLFSSFVPQKPRISINKQKRYYASIVKQKMMATYNDKNKKLLVNMLAVIDSLGDDGAANDFRFGTYRFEYVWESMIDKAFGVSDKAKYFPKTRWIVDQDEIQNASLEPDSIMISNDKIYVIDAKYYKYGSTANPSHLPESASINKQITYGEYIAETGKFKTKNGDNPIVYNAFIMPYNSYKNGFETDNEFHYIGSAYSDWKSSDGTKPYEEIAGVLVDVKSLMKNHSHSEDRIIELAKLIEEKVGKNG